MQIETRNPHFHEDKGEEHLKEMTIGSLASIYHSRICPPKIREKILEALRGKAMLDNGDIPPIQKIACFKDVNLRDFSKLLSNAVSYAQ
jgi:mannosyl-3-phosphoglycerate synthase